jgi:hypothetical protein
MWGFWWTKLHWGRFSPSTSVSPANHSINFSIIIITRVWKNRPLVAAVPSGPNWTPPPTNYLAVCLSVYPPLIFVKRLLKLPCCVCVPHNFIVFYEVRVMSKESRRLAPLRNNCYLLVHPICFLIWILWNKSLLMPILLLCSCTM